ncbi:hypothetical protein R3P38DRAFT_2813948 [Favolaschia claudopus]|uniref:SAP domain-containing protein n=1 Tax=Favolaschia claudopus TaxID=2862362 RepID=A0AAV9Z4T2_9AGAR
MRGFDQIYDELVNPGESDDGGKVSQVRRGSCACSTGQNIPVLKELCRENGCKVGGNKEDLLDRLLGFPFTYPVSIFLTSIGKPLPGRSDVERIKKSPALANAGKPAALSNKTNLHTTKVVLKAGNKRKLAETDGKEN